MAFCLAACSSQAEQTCEGKKYDLEHHFYLPEFIEYMKTHTEVPYIDTVTNIFWYRENLPWPLSLEGCDVEYPGIEKGATILDFMTLPIEAHIKEMDDKGVDVAVISTSHTVEELPREQSVYLSKK